MRINKLVPVIGASWTLLYALFIIWLYTVAPQSLEEVATGARVVTRTYEINQERFAAGLEAFRNERYEAAREEWRAADPATRDARTQFYIAYSFYRQGWGRLYNDDELFRQGIEAANRALALAPPEGLRVNDENLQLQTPAELRAEMTQGTERSWSDLNPGKLLRERK